MVQGYKCEGKKLIEFCADIFAGYGFNRDDGKAIAEQLEIMETGTMIQFDVETDDETGVMTIVKLYEKTE